MVQRALSDKSYLLLGLLSPLMHTLTNSEDPDVRVYIVCINTKLSSKKEIQFYFEIIVCDPLMYKMDQFETRKKNPLVHKGIKCQWLVN